MGGHSKYFHLIIINHESGSIRRGELGKAAGPHAQTTKSHMVGSTGHEGKIVGCFMTPYVECIGFNVSIWSYAMVAYVML